MLITNWQIGRLVVVGPIFTVGVVASALWLSAAEQPTAPEISAPVRAEAVDPGLKAPAVDEPENYRTGEYRTPVPATLQGAKVVSAEDASKMWNDGSAVFIDVYPYAPKPPNLPAGTIWREPQHFSIENAKWLANIGYGVLSVETEAYFKRHLERLTGGDRAKALVFFCVRNCWMSWNSGKRALTYGYTNVYWFSEGTDAWQEIGLPVEAAKPEP
jgi:PQQ-dependent catabolism-associated CXXCW motif protein